ncbi:MAG: endonuclease III [Spirochaetia bacterium]|nr:endonuclease III [Spirochaetia bacterium]
MDKKSKAVLIADTLDAHYPPEIQFLHFKNSFELLIAVILSAQTTDEQVMRVVPALFDKFPTPEKMAKADIPVLEKLIHATGFFHAKAKNIKATSQKLLELYGGVVPSTIEELIKLPGVGRKTANVVVGTLFDKPAVIVDTHFKRVTYRLGLTKNTEPDKVEADIRKLLPPEKQYRFSMTANLHGRECCHARKPECDICILKDLCSYGRTSRI